MKKKEKNQGSPNDECLTEEKSIAVFLDILAKLIARYYIRNNCQIVQEYVDNDQTERNIR